MALKESQNKSIKKGLIETFQRQDAKLYEALSKINADVDTIYEKLFNGPLPAVSGEDLTHIDPINIDSPGDVPQIVTSPGNVAFINWPNVFIEDQKILKTSPQFIASAGNNGDAHFQQPFNGAALVGANVYWNAGWAADVAGLGTLLYMAGGGFTVYHWDGANLVRRYDISPTGLHAIGNPTHYGGAGLGDMVFESQGDIRASNAAGTTSLSMMRLDANDLVGLGSDAANTGKGHVAIPQVTAANLPAAGAAKDGIIVIDKTNNRLCFYHSTVRFYVLGTAF